MRAAEPEVGAAPAGPDRALVYAALARLFRPPDPDTLDCLRTRELPALRQALQRLGASGDLAGAAREVSKLLTRASRERLEAAYQQTFEASGGLRCPPNETSHTAESPQHALTRTFEIADVAGFYRAFGVEMTPGGERPDHISAELEFMHLLALKEMVALREEGEAERVEICRDAARTFLRDHLARWAGLLADRLEEPAADPLYAAAGRLLHRFVAFDDARLNAG